MRQGALQRLARETERYAQFFEHVPDAYLVTDPGGSVREANRAALALLDAAREDVVGKPLGALVTAAFSVQRIACAKSGSRSRCWLVRPAGQA